MATAAAKSPNAQHTPNPSKLEAAIAASDKRTAKAGRGPTIKLRATARGYYGLAGAVADLIDPGTEFPFAVSDFVPFNKERPGVYADGRPVRPITVRGTEYALPSWCEDAAQPSSLGADEDEESFEDAAPGKDDDVI